MNRGAKSRNTSYEVRLSMLKLSNGLIYDLLETDKLNKVKQTRKLFKNGIYVKGLVEMRVNSTRELENAFYRGMSIKPQEGIRSMGISNCHHIFSIILTKNTLVVFTFLCI